MTTLKVMSIIGIAIFILSIVFIYIFSDPYGNNYDIDAALGWGLIPCLYGIAFSIVVIVQAFKKR